MVTSGRFNYGSILGLALVLATNASTALARIENTDSAVSYSSGWTTDTSRTWSGASAHTSKNAGAQAIVTFQATSITWIGMRTPATGIARVYIDGVLRATVDTYAPNSQEVRIPVFTVNDLGNVTHTMTIEATGQKNAGSSDSRIYVDAFDAPSVSVSRLQETDPSINYTSGWTSFDQTKPWSEGKAAFASATGAQATFPFNGTGIAWIGARLSNTGIAAIYLDGMHVADVDTYAASQQIQAELYNSGTLADGPHTLAVQVSGTKNAKSSGTTIYNDAFEVTIPGKRYQDWDSQVVYAPSGNNWAFLINDHAYHEGTVAETIVGGSTATFSFNGTGVSFVSGTCPRCGIIQVSLDNGAPGTVDLYSADDAPQKTVYAATGLTPGAHTLKVTVTGQKNPLSSYYWAVVDAFDVISTSGGATLPPVLTGVLSRKTHGGAGSFDMPLNSNALDPATEPRSDGTGNHMVVFGFDKPVNGGTASVIAGNGSPGTPTFSGNEMRVPLSGVADMQYVTISVSNVVATDGGTGGAGSIRIGFLAGDVNSSRTVTLSDVLSVNAGLAQPVSAANYLRDVNLTGTLTLSDVLLIQSKLTHSLPGP